jgi:hypothetical protein
MGSRKSRAPLPKWRKHETLSRKWFQVRIIICYILILLGGALGLSYAIYRYSYKRIRFEMFRGHSDVSTPWEILSGYILTANGIAVAAVILVAIVVTILMMRTVSRGARGLTENLMASQNGVLPRDWKPPLGTYEFQHLHRVLGEALETNNEKTEELRLLARLVGEKARSLQAKVEKKGVQEYSEALRDLHVQYEKLRSAYTGFSVREG